MSRSQSSTDLVNQVRAQLDEFNAASITDAHILDALNRAMKAATRVTSRRMDTIFLATETVRTAAGQTEYDMPSDIFDQRVEKVELSYGGSLRRLEHISYKNRHPWYGQNITALPFYYDIIGTQMRFYPTPSGSFDVIVHYTRSPDKLVASQGQVNRIDRTNNYIIVEGIGDGLTTETDTRDAYVNFVDYQTGDVKATMQVAYVDDGIGQVKFKSSGLTRSQVLGKTVVTAIPTEVAEDDFICLVHGTCVPQLPDAYSDYLIQHAIVALKRRTREPTEDEYQALKDIETDLKKIVFGRENSMRVRRANNSYGRQLGSTLRRYFG